MAWVRPKNPPKSKAKADPIETFAPLLSYISNRRLSPRPTSPTKNIPPVAPLSSDPILRSLQQSQKALHVEEPVVVYEEDQDESDYQPAHRDSHRPKTRDEERSREQPSPPAVPRYQRKAPPNLPRPPPTLPQPPPITRQKPRVPSYERPRPAERVRERFVSQPIAYPVYSERVSSRAVSARWASATTPLDLR
ncbi:MAG: hypothetical protein LQ348_004571 [Seirophora lacunosa]|nr:MAG: hypothetical protein LQ348_004571 [Seirophora lacunosa]